MRRASTCVMWVNRVTTCDTSREQNVGAGAEGYCALCFVTDAGKATPTVRNSQLSERRGSGGGPKAGSEDDGGRAVARYLADMTGQLESMARAAKLELLAYLLAMARAEAEAASLDEKPREGGAQDR